MPVDDLIGLLIGCRCKGRCCCPEPEETRPPAGGNLFQQQPRTVNPPQLIESAPFVPRVTLSLAALPLTEAGLIVGAGYGAPNGHGDGGGLSAALVNLNLPIPITTQPFGGLYSQPTVTQAGQGYAHVVPVATTTSGNMLHILYGVRWQDFGWSGYYPAFILAQLNPYTGQHTVLATNHTAPPHPLNYSEVPEFEKWFGISGCAISTKESSTPGSGGTYAGNQVAVAPWSAIGCDEGRIHMASLVNLAAYVPTYTDPETGVSGNVRAELWTVDVVAEGSTLTATWHEGWGQAVPAAGLRDSFLGPSGPLPGGGLFLWSKHASTVFYSTFTDGVWTLTGNPTDPTAITNTQNWLISPYVNALEERQDALWDGTQTVFRTPGGSVMGFTPAGTLSSFPGVNNRYEEHRTGAIRNAPPVPIHPTRPDYTLSVTGSPLDVQASGGDEGDVRLRVPATGGQGARFGDVFTQGGNTFIITAGHSAFVDVRAAGNPLPVSVGDTLQVTASSSDHWTLPQSPQAVRSPRRLPLLRVYPTSSSADPPGAPPDPARWRGDVAGFTGLDPDNPPRTAILSGPAGVPLTVTFPATPAADGRTVWLTLTVRLGGGGTLTLQQGSTVLGEVTVPSKRWRQERVRVTGLPTTITLTADAPAAISALSAEYDDPTLS